MWEEAVKICHLSVLFVACAGLVFAQTPLLLRSTPPAPEEVLQALEALGLPPEFTATFSAALLSGFATGRATTTVSLLLLQDLVKLPRDQVLECLEVIRYALSQGFIVDTGLAGSSMMNEARKLLALGRSGEEIVSVLRARLGFLLATRSVLVRSGLISPPVMDPQVPATSADRVVLELAWAVGDFILWEGGSPGDPRFLGYVQDRLNRLSALGVCPMEAGKIASALTPAMLAEIVQLAFQPERR